MYIVYVACLSVLLGQSLHLEFCYILNGCIVFSVLEEPAADKCYKRYSFASQENSAILETVSAVALQIKILPRDLCCL